MWQLRCFGVPPQSTDLRLKPDRVFSIARETSSRIAIGTRFIFNRKNILSVNTVTPLGEFTRARNVAIKEQGFRRMPPHADSIEKAIWDRDPRDCSIGKRSDQSEARMLRQDPNEASWDRLSEIKGMSVRGREKSEPSRWQILKISWEICERTKEVTVVLMGREILSGI